MSFEGVFPILVTPFKEQEEIDAEKVSSGRKDLEDKYGEDIEDLRCPMTMYLLLSPRMVKLGHFVTIVVSD